MRISDWSSDVCSSDLQVVAVAAATGRLEFEMQIQRASAVERPVHQLLLRGVERFRRPCEAAAYFKHDAIAAQGADDAIQRFLQPALVGWMLRTAIEFEQAEIGTDIERTEIGTGSVREKVCEK